LQRGFVQPHSIEKEAAYDGPVISHSQTYSPEDYSQSGGYSEPDQSREYSGMNNYRSQPGNSMAPPPPLPDRVASRNSGIIQKTQSLNDYPGPPPGRPPPSRTEAMKAISTRPVPQQSGGTPRPPESPTKSSGLPRPPPMGNQPRGPPPMNSSPASSPTGSANNRLTVNRPVRNNLLQGIRSFSKLSSLKTVDPSDVRRPSVQQQDMQNVLSKSLNKYRQFVMDEQDVEDDNEQTWMEE